MAMDEHSDEETLLEHPAGIARGLSKFMKSRFGHEEDELSLSDIGSQKWSTRSFTSSQHAPSYESLSYEYQREHEEIGGEDDDGKKSDTRFRPIETLKNRATTFTTLAPPVKENFGKFRRYITRSGSAISYEDTNLLLSAERKFRKYSGWRGGAFAASIAAGVVLLLNIVFTIWAGAKSKSGTSIGSIYEGQCDTVRRADAWLHIVINVLGTTLLGASNYTMQCLSSPTRKEVDAAHSRGSYLDIGLPSLRNLNGWKKKTLFGLIVTSTLPLHFLWNSAVFTTTQPLDYNVYVVTPSFFNSATVDCSQNVSIIYTGNINSGLWEAPLYDLYPLQFNNLESLGYGFPSSNETWYTNDTCSMANALLANATSGHLDRLTNEECINAYGSGDGYMSGRGNMLAVAKQQASFGNTTVLMATKFEMFVSNFTDNNWICSPNYLIANDYRCDLKTIASNANSWALGMPRASDSDPYRLAPTQDWEIDYCLSQPLNLGGHCQLQYSLIIMLCVLTANFIKMTCILLALHLHFEPVLATLGDAISSFLANPDPYTAGRPFLTRKMARRFKKLPPPGPVYYQKPRWAPKWAPKWFPNWGPRWYQAPSLTRLLVTLFLCILAISLVIFLLAIGNQNLGSSPYSLGFGSYNSAATLHIFPWSSDGSASTDLSSTSFSSNTILLSMVAIANLPQAIVSCLYFAYNTVYTSFLSAAEWARFSREAKTLRTTDPLGGQRSTYWLSLPWTYALPLATASSVLHWLISQSLFIARTEVLSTTGAPEPLSYMEVGYSPLAILLSVLFGSCMVLAMLINGARKLGGDSVLVGGNSLAIAAACRREEEEEGLERLRVVWGVIRHEAGGVPGKVGFTGLIEKCERPREGGLYTT